MSINEALRWRYATKKFDPTRVVEEPKVESILESANLTASSYGLQPYQFVVLQDRTVREELVASSFGQRQVVDSSHLIIIAIRTDIDEDFIRQFIGLKESQRELPAGSLTGYGQMMAKSIAKMAQPERQDWAARQAYIAMGTMMAACAVEQVDACPMEGFMPDVFNSRLNLTARNLHAQLLMPIGYRSSEDETQFLVKVRRPLEEVVIRL